MRMFDFAIMIMNFVRIQLNVSNLRLDIFRKK